MLAVHSVRYPLTWALHSHFAADSAAVAAAHLLRATRPRPPLVGRPPPPTRLSGRLKFGPCAYLWSSRKTGAAAFLDSRARTACAVRYLWPQPPNMGPAVSRISERACNLTLFMGRGGAGLLGLTYPPPRPGPACLSSAGSWPGHLAWGHAAVP